MHKFKSILLSATCFFLLHNATAQTFHPDKNGYVSDTKFHKLIKDRKYVLVGSFDTIQKTPLILAARFLKDGNWGLMNTQGKVLDDPRFVNFTNPSDSVKKRFYKTPDANKNQVVITKSGGLFGASLQNGKVLLQPEYEYVIKPIQADNYLIVKKQNRYGVVSLNNKILIPLKHDFVSTGWATKNVVIVSDRGKQALYSLQNIQITPFKYFNITGFEKNGLSVFSIKNNSGVKLGVLDTLGHERIAAKYDQIDMPLKQKSIIVSTKQPKLALLMDLNGNPIGKLDYTTIREFVGDYAIVSRGIGNDMRLGKIDSTGQEVIETKYTLITSFINDYGLSMVKLDDKYGLVNKKGVVIVPIVYDMMEVAFHYIENNGLITRNVKHNGFIILKEKKSGLLGPKGNLLINTELDGIRATEQYGFILYRNTKFGFANDEGKILIPMKFDGFSLIGGKEIFHGIMRTKYEGRTCKVDMYGGEYLGSK